MALQTGARKRLLAVHLPPPAAIVIGPWDDVPNPWKRAHSPPALDSQPLPHPDLTPQSFGALTDGAVCHLPNTDVAVVVAVAAAMSLNGLDDAKVAEAYQAALAEAGGWFLLKYVSRDAVEVLARGTGGAAEARGAIAQFEDASPLYGFVLYRRRKVLITYVPEGTSRLLKARVAVHFTAVTEKFTPHDTTISIATADELSDAALISACSLHTAAPSSCSSSGSSRRNKLDEITEDAEEGQSVVAEAVTPPRPATAASSTPAIVEPAETPGAKASEVPTVTPSPEAPKPSTSSEEKKRAPESKPAPELSHVTIEAVSEEESQPELLPPNFRDSLKHFDSLFEHGPDPRLSSQTARPAMSDLYAEIYAQYNKPKVKLGPRPRPSLDSKRPRTSGHGEQSTARPISSLPAGLRVANRKTMEPKRPKSRDSSVVPSIAFPPPPPVPEIPLSPMFPPHRPASVKSMPSHSHRSHGVTPEKQRLMKALELRKKQMKAKKEQEQKKAEGESEDANAGAEEPSTKDDEALVMAGSMETVTEEVSTVAKTEDEPATLQHKDDDLSSIGYAAALDDIKSSMTHDDEDTGLEMIDSRAETDDLHSAVSASSPTSAQTQGSSCAPSTRPSSISEDDHHIPEEDVKIENTQESANPESANPEPANQESTDQESTNQEVDESPESSQNEDEKESVESSPTVVPENDSSIPSVQITPQPEPQPETAVQASASGDVLVRKSRRESMVLMPPTMQDDGSSRRRSNRHSMIYLPSESSAQHEDSQNTRQKRESVTLSTSKRQSFVEVKEKRRAVVSPIQIHLSAENSDAEYLSDDSFMEELQSAKLEQAKPVSVSKSPIAQYFPRKSSITEVTTPQRSTSSQYKPGRLSPEQLGGRKTSGTWPPQSTADPVVVAKKINVSSGISQRIKALAEKSNSRDSLVLSVSPLASPDATSSIVAQRKSSFFSTTPPSGNSPPGKTMSRFNRASFVPVAFSATTPDKTTVIQPPPKNIEQTVYNLQQQPAKPESVQVTARIVRDARVQKPALTMPTESTPLELHQSPIIIDHQKSTRPSSRSSKHSSPTKMEPTSPSSNHPRSSSESSWRSFGRRMSESKSSGGLPRSISTHSLEITEEKREEKKEKKDSRTSKLFKRMSTISSISRKGQSSNNPSVQEEERQSYSLPSLREPPPAVQVGDLNVQFPDTLLWKRRWVEIDASGNLVLSLSRSNEQSKGITKRFHLSEFRTPYTPDQDRQELPNSVILDFIDGRTLQCACETYMAQIQILQILREAHDAWLAYNQFQ
ncbi:hypothetical protein K505DRAFT_364516 [Melanomma pulvis-pyrius CBS 109.77]|uniref:ADF-H domain-containing protein n=1 Tax=Melanomma pulvis-pyrius CBS 109.77 TaxID=1314802 RepID=A0A6A6X2T8_9PLEO|nr:hypothetical protein K505DRAFT_364516 [Melanomma pulvis-pyrius CBS 109.77]